VSSKKLLLVAARPIAPPKWEKGLKLQIETIPPMLHTDRHTPLLLQDIELVVIGGW